MESQEYINSYGDCEDSFQLTNRLIPIITSILSNNVEGTAKAIPLDSPLEADLNILFLDLTQ